MPESLPFCRRQFLNATVFALAAPQLFSTCVSASAIELPAREGSVTASSKGSMGIIKHVNAGELNVGYADFGPIDGPPVLLLHGWPYDIHTYVDVAPRLAAAGHRVVVPFLRGYGSTSFLSPDTPRNGQQAALAVDAIAFMDALDIDSATIAGCDWGARTTNIIAALWPERCRAMVSVSGYLIGSQELNRSPLPPEGELQWWYQYYFATERGQAGYQKFTSQFAKLIWRQASPKWAFDDVVFDRSAIALMNPDHVAISIDNYRWRLSITRGDNKYSAIEDALSTFPVIRVPTITMEGDANGAPHPDPRVYAKKYSAQYQHRLITGGIGHNLPQEAPEAFAQAVIDVQVL